MQPYNSFTPMEADDSNENTPPEIFGFSKDESIDSTFQVTNPF